MNMTTHIWNTSFLFPDSASVKLKFELDLIGHTTSPRCVQVKPIFLEPSHWGTFGVVYLPPVLVLWSTHIFHLGGGGRAKTTACANKWHFKKLGHTWLIHICFITVQKERLFVLIFLCWFFLFIDQRLAIYLEKNRYRHNGNVLLAGPCVAKCSKATLRKPLKGVDSKVYGHSLAL